MQLNLKPITEAPDLPFPRPSTEGKYHALIIALNRLQRGQALQVQAAPGEKITRMGINSTLKKKNMRDRFELRPGADGDIWIVPK